MAETLQPFKAVKIFFSYSHEDEKLRNELSNHLALLRHQHVITEWHDRKIGPGKEWQDEIDQQLKIADIVLFLVSSDFLASDYCYSVEVSVAMKRHEAGEAIVIPVILRPVDWKGAPFAKLQALPKDAKPVTEWSNQDQAFLNVSQGVRAAIEKLMAGQMSHLPQEDRPKSGREPSSSVYWSIQFPLRRFISTMHNHPYVLATIFLFTVIISIGKFTGAFDGILLVSSERSSDANLYAKSDGYRYNSGVMNMKAGKYNEAIEDFIQVIASDPNNINAYYNRGSCYMKKGDCDKAIRDFSEVIKREPNRGGAYHNRGVCYQRIGQNDKAMADFKKEQELK